MHRPQNLSRIYIFLWNIQNCIQIISQSKPVLIMQMDSWDVFKIICCEFLWWRQKNVNVKRQDSRKRLSGAETGSQSETVSPWRRRGLTDGKRKAVGRFHEDSTNRLHQFSHCRIRWKRRVEEWSVRVTTTDGANFMEKSKIVASCSKVAPNPHLYDFSFYFRHMQ